MKPAILAITILVLISYFKLSSCLISNELEEEEYNYIASPIDLTHQNFTEAIKTDNYLVLFYWPK